MADFLAVVRAAADGLRILGLRPRIAGHPFYEEDRPDDGTVPGKNNDIVFPLPCIVVIILLFLISTFAFWKKRPSKRA